MQFSPIHWLSIMFIQVPSFSHLFLNKLYWLGINLEGYTPLLSPWPKHDIGKSAVMIRMRRPLGADSVWKHVSDVVYTSPFTAIWPWHAMTTRHRNPQKAICIHMCWTYAVLPCGRTNSQFLQPSHYSNDQLLAIQTTNHMLIYTIPIYSHVVMISGISDLGQHPQELLYTIGDSYTSPIYSYTDWWFQTCFIFHNIWDVILPIDELIFFSLVAQPPTSILFI